MPLVRQTLHVGGEDIHVALWPSVKEMHQIASRHYAFEGRCFVVAAGGIMRSSDLPRELEPASHLSLGEDEYLLNGGSAVIGPDGMYVAGPTFGAEVIVLARINLDRIREESLTLDVTGHFNRPDLFDFHLRTADGLFNEKQSELLPEPREALAVQIGSDVLLPSGTEGASLRILPSSRAMNFEAD